MIPLVISVLILSIGLVSSGFISNSNIQDLEALLAGSSVIIRLAAASQNDGGNNGDYEGNGDDNSATASEEREGSRENEDELDTQEQDDTMQRDTSEHSLALGGFPSKEFISEPPANDDNSIGDAVVPNVEVETIIRPGGAEPGLPSGGGEVGGSQNFGFGPTFVPYISPTRGQTVTSPQPCVSGDSPFGSCNDVNTQNQQNTGNNALAQQGGSAGGGNSASQGIGQSQ